jgi:hypothetical protein
MLAGLPQVQHVTTTVLADKLELVRALTGHGFEVCAYLPAWYNIGQCRYDCIQLTRSQYSDAPATQDFPDLLGCLQAAFQANLAFYRPEEIRTLVACA